MKTSESIKEIAAALPKAQAAITSAKKDVTNTFFKSKYADLGSVIEACRGALNAQGITILQSVRATDNGVAVETILLHTSGEWISAELEMPVAKADAQGVGSAITYTKRYGLQALVGIPSEDDDGNAAAASKPKTGFENSSRTVAKTELDAMSPADQEIMRVWADTITDLHNAGMEQDAADKYYDLDSNEKKMAVWALLDSKIRTSIKKLHKVTASDIAATA